MKPKDFPFARLALSVSLFFVFTERLAVVASEDVEVVTSTSVSVRVSTSEDHVVPKESIINQQVVNKKNQDVAHHSDMDAEQKKKTADSVTSSFGKVPSSSTTSSDVTGTATDGNEEKKNSHQKSSHPNHRVTVKAFGSTTTTESPTKFRVRQRATAQPSFSVTDQKNTEVTPLPSTTAAATSEGPPRRKRKRPAGYRRPQVRPHPPQENIQPPPPNHYQSPPPRPQENAPLPQQFHSSKRLPHQTPLQRSPTPPANPPAAPQQPQVRPRPVQFQPQFHQALPLPQHTFPQAPPLVHAPPQTESPAFLPPTSIPPPPTTTTTTKKPQQQKPFQKKQHRAPESQPQRRLPHPSLAPQPFHADHVTRPPTSTKQTPPTNKSSFLSYFSFGQKKQENEPVPAPAPLSAPPPPNPLPSSTRHHHNPQHYPQQQVGSPVDDQSHRGGDSTLKQQPKFPKTTKGHLHKAQKSTKKQQATRDEDFPIPPPVPIPPPRYEEQYRPLETAQPNSVQKTTIAQTSVPPPSSHHTHEPTRSSQAPIETQRPYHHVPNYTPPPSPPPPQFIFNYQQEQQHSAPQYLSPQPQSDFQAGRHHYDQPQYLQQEPQKQFATSQHQPYAQDLTRYSPSQQVQPHQGGFQSQDHLGGYQSSQGHQLYQSQDLNQGYLRQPQSQDTQGYQPQLQSQDTQGYQAQDNQGYQHSASQDHQGFQSSPQGDHHQHQEGYQPHQPQTLLVQVPHNVNPSQGGHIELPQEMLKALGVKSVAPGVSSSADLGLNSASVAGQLANGHGVVEFDGASNRPYVRPNIEAYHHQPDPLGYPVPVDVSRTPFTKGTPHGFPTPSKIQVDEKTQVSLSGVVLPHNGLKTAYNELPPTQVNLNEPLNVHIPISQLPPRPAVNVRIKGPNGKVSEVLVPLHEGNTKNGGFHVPSSIGSLLQSHSSGGSQTSKPPKKFLSDHHHQYYGRKHHTPYGSSQQLYGSPSTAYIQYSQSNQAEPLQASASNPQASWIGGWGSSIRNMGTRIGSIFSRKASSS